MGRRRTGDRATRGRRKDPVKLQKNQFDDKCYSHCGAEGQISNKPFLQLGEIHVQHHHDEEKEDRHRADIDDDEDHREKLGAQKNEERRRVEESDDQKEYRMHRITRRYDHRRRCKKHSGEQVKGDLGQNHTRVPHLSYRYGASS